MSSADTPKTIVLKTRGQPIHAEFPAADSAGLVPGMLVEINSDGEALPHDTAGNPGLIVAREPDYIGQGIDHEFADGEIVPVWYPVPGEQFFGWLASGQNLVQGALVMSDGSGRLTAHTGAGDGNQALGRVDEAVNATAAAARVKITAL